MEARWDFCSVGGMVHCVDGGGGFGGCVLIIMVACSCSVFMAPVVSLEVKLVVNINNFGKTNCVKRCLLGNYVFLILYEAGISDIIIIIIN